MLRWILDWKYPIYRKLGCRRGVHLWERDGEGDPWCYACGGEYL